MSAYALLSFGWMAAAILLFWFESITVNLVSIWFAVGCTAALLLSLFNHSFLAQFFLFIVVSLVSLIATRPLVAKLRTRPTATNGDRLPGRTAKVLTVVTPTQAGRVHIDGTDWNACTTGAVLQPGSLCRVVDTRSTTLIVEPQQVPSAPAESAPL